MRKYSVGVISPPRIYGYTKADARLLRRAPELGEVIYYSHYAKGARSCQMEGKRKIDWKYRPTVG